MQDCINITLKMTNKDTRVSGLCYCYLIAKHDVSMAINLILSVMKLLKFLLTIFISPEILISSYIYI